jgi:hypothetical protein
MTTDSKRLALLAWIEKSLAAVEKDYARLKRLLARADKARRRLLNLARQLGTPDERHAGAGPVRGIGGGCVSGASPDANQPLGKVAMRDRLQEFVRTLPEREVSIILAAIERGQLCPKKRRRTKR